MIKHKKVKIAQTTNKCIEKLNDVKSVSICLNQHSLGETNCLVSINDKVKKGQLIAQSNDGFSKIYSSISGQVKEIIKQPIGDFVSTHVVIENDFMDEKSYLLPLYKPTTEQIISRLNEVGIIDDRDDNLPLLYKMGKVQKPIAIVIDAYENTPYIFANRSVASEYSKKLVIAANMISSVCNNCSIIFAINQNDVFSYANLFDAVQENKNACIRVKSIKKRKCDLKSDELVKSTLKIKVLPTKSIFDYGVFTLDVQTLYAIYQAIVEGKPQVEKVVTIGGKAIKKQGNFIVPLGLMVDDIIKSCEGFVCEYETIESFKLNAMEALNDEINIKNELANTKNPDKKKELSLLLKEKRKEANDKIFSKLKTQYNNFMKCLSCISMENNGCIEEIYFENQSIMLTTNAVLFYNNTEFKSAKK